MKIARKIFLGAVCVFTAGAMISCSEKKEGEDISSVSLKQNSSAVQAPQMLAESPLVVKGGPVVDLGYLCCYDEYPGEFEITNTGKIPFPLDDVSSSCSCTVVDENAETVVIAPGETYKMTFTLKAHKMNIGPFTRVISIVSKFCPKTDLTVKGTIYSCVRASLGEKWDFGNIVSMRETLSTEFDLTGIEDFKESLELGQPKNDLFDVVMEKTGNATYHVKVTSKEVLPLGSYSGTILFPVLQPRPGVNFGIKVSGQVGEAIRMMNARINLDRYRWQEGESKATYFCYAGMIDEKYYDILPEDDLAKVKSANARESKKQEKMRHELEADPSKKISPSNNWKEINDNLSWNMKKDEEMIQIEKYPCEAGILLKITVDKAFLSIAEYKSVGINVLCFGKKISEIRLNTGNLENNIPADGEESVEE